jgi:hypothetical protein
MVKIMTQLQIANRALNRLGARPITEVSVSSSDKNSRIMAELYDQSLKTVLSECLWTFATKRILLTSNFPDDWVSSTSYTLDAKVTHGEEYFISLAAGNQGNVPEDNSFWASYEYPAWTIYNLTFVYQYPADIVRIFGWNVPSATVRQEVDQFGVKVILSDSVELGVLYTFFNEDPAQYTHSFTEAFVDKLAYDASFMILNSATKTESLLKRYEALSLQKASAENAQDQTPQTPNSSGWVNAKFQGDLLIRNREIRWR